MNPRLWLVTSIFAAATTGSPAYPQESAPVRDLEPRIDRIFSDYDSPKSPGCAVGVVKDGKLEFSKAYGMADIERGVPLGPALPFCLASESKQFTAAAVLLAAKRGKLDLDDDFRKYIPDFPDYGSTITLQHLLHHASGIRDYTTLWLMRGEKISDAHTAAETIALLARQRALNFPPGADFLYSNSGYFLLAVILERATGQSLAGYAREHLFKPLGMEHSRFLGDSQSSETDHPRGHVPVSPGEFAAYPGNRGVVGARGVVTTIADLAKWERAFHEGKIGADGLVEAMLTPGRLADGASLHYAAGLVVGDFDGTPTVSHGGEGDGSGALILRFPELDLSVMCLCNVAGSGAAGRAWRTAIPFLFGPYREALVKLQENRPAPQFVSVEPSVLERLAGAYRDRNTRAIWEVRVEGDNLLLDARAGRSLLRPLSETRFQTPGPGQTTIAGFEGGRMRVETEDQRPVVFEKVELVSPSESALAACAGTYRSDELQIPWMIEHRGGRLYFAGEGAPQEPLEPTVSDEFALGAELRISFGRGEDGRVNSMSAHTDRVWNLRFERAD